MIKKAKPWLALLASLVAVFAAQAKGDDAVKQQPPVLTVSYPEMRDQHYRDFDNYFLTLLDIALAHTQKPYRLMPVSIPVVSEGRSENNLQAGLYDVHWLNTNAVRERNLQPIRIPLFKGLFGWRLMFIRKEDQVKFSKIESLAQLQEYTATQGHDWPDNAILRANGIPLFTTASWEGLYKMLPARRADFFPRSIIEIWREKRLYPDNDLHIEEHLALRYPAAYYFFVKKESVQLARLIEKGLLTAIENGQFDGLFDTQFAAIIAQARLSDRTIIELQRNSLSFPRNPRFWYVPARTPQNSTK